MYHVYVIQSSSGISKIGISSNAYRRLSETQVNNHEQLFLASVIVTKDEISAKELESHLHIVLQPYWVRGEWFDIPSVILQSIVSILAIQTLSVQFPVTVSAPSKIKKPAKRSAASAMATEWLIANPDKLDLSVRELAEMIGVGKDSVARAKRELQK